MWMCCTRSTKKAVCWKNASAGWNLHAIQAISESVDSALRTKTELRAALGTYIRQMLALLGMLTPQAYSTASLDVRDVLGICCRHCSGEPDKASAFWPDRCDACRTLYRLSGEQLDIYVRPTQPAYAADLHLGEPNTAAVAKKKTGLGREQMIQKISAEGLENAGP